ncbi:MAG: hypothetical protein EON50_02985 [Acidovorax sp.]|nr:MAG: hypothetical protein EON50_02985 [Acidovorax sp.]
MAWTTWKSRRSCASRPTSRVHPPERLRRFPLLSARCALREGGRHQRGGAALARCLWHWAVTVYTTALPIWLACSSAAQPPPSGYAGRAKQSLLGATCVPGSLRRGSRLSVSYQGHRQQRVVCAGSAH